MPWWKFWAKDEASSEGPDYYEEGVALVRQERYHDALTSFRLALRNKPNDPATIEQMAVVYTRIGLSEEAIRSYREALRLRPKSPSAHYGLAFLLLREGEEAGAIQHLERFLATEQSGWEEDRHVIHARSTLAKLTGEGGATEEDPGAADADEPPPAPETLPTREEAGDERGA